MTLRELIRQIVRAVEGLVDLAVEYALYLWNGLLNLPAVFYLFVIIVVLARRTVVYFGIHFVDTVRGRSRRAKFNETAGNPTSGG